jgi:hypothetical protein
MMGETLKELSECLIPFAIEVILIMFITNTQEKSEGNCCLRSLWNVIKHIFKLNAYQKSRLKGLLIILVGVVVGVVIQAKGKISHEPSLIFEGMAQMAYLFAAAVAAVYISHGYDLNQKEIAEKTEKGRCNE